MNRRLFLSSLLSLAAITAAPFTGVARASSTLRLFLIGNSFSQNATRYLPQIAKEAGNDLTIGRAEYPSCTLETHWKAVEIAEANPDDPKGKLYGGKSLRELLATGTWDIVTIQQGSFQSGDINTYRPYAEKLRDYIHKLQPRAEVVIHQTWAYRSDAAKFAMVAPGRTAMSAQEMWEKSREAYQTTAKELGIRLIPVGDAFWRVTTNPEWGYKKDAAFDFPNPVAPNLPDQANSLNAGYRWEKDATGKEKLTLDANHASDAGCYLAGLVWYGMLFKASPDAVRFTPAQVPAAFAAYLRRAATETLAAGSGAAARPVEAAVKPLPYTGTNLAGAEFGQWKPDKPLVHERDYGYPNAQEIEYFAAQGMNTFRIPFRWELLQPKLKGELDPTELGRLDTVVKAATGKGYTVILDPHNYARYTDKIIGAGEITNADFADLWVRFARLYKNNPHVWFGLVNEPYGMPTQQWLDAANAAIAAIRKEGAKNKILVPGNYWTGAHSWVRTDNDEIMIKIVDPANNFIYDVHQYLDSDSSGSKPVVVSPTIGSERLKTFTEWCRANKKQALLGEFAVAPGEEGKAAIHDMLTYMEANRDVWMGFTWWAAGPRWGDYMFSIEPKDGADKPQMEYLRPHLQPRKTAR